MDNTAAGVAEGSMHDTILLAEMSLMVLAILDVVDLHTIVTF